MDNKVDLSDWQVVNAYEKCKLTANELGLELGQDEEGFFIVSNFHEKNLIDPKNNYRRYLVNDIREIEVFLEAWTYSMSYYKTFHALNP